MICSVDGLRSGDTQMTCCVGGNSITDPRLRVMNAFHRRAQHGTLEFRYATASGLPGILRVC